MAATRAMMDLLKAAVMGVVEGLTEFIPVSSTGHLIVASRLLDFGNPTFEIFIQLGAILALTWEYRHTLLRLASEGVEPGSNAQRFILRVLVAFLPAAVVGLLFHHWIESHLFRPETVSASLIVGGILILALDGPWRSGGLHDFQRVSLGQALGIGCGQVLSLMPGVSRAGATILSGLVAGLDRRAATEFSFFLALPTMYAACLFALWKGRHDLDTSAALALAVGFVTAFASALVVIRALLRFVQSNSLRPFGWYRIAAGLVLAAWLLLGR
jgi:undecaprenyl-diphosphatase